MISKFEKEFICMLHSNHDCENRNYRKNCAMSEDSGYAKRTCQYRVEAVVLAAAENEESPVSDVQQPQPKRADEMMLEIEQVF